ncbi:hypothetical protein C5B85_13735 [Pseudoclavibacter sp. AY1F1]|nr:hypothetical protein C5B85_13735 [Pseudoclavibacter sp. AY1F1]
MLWSANVLSNLADGIAFVSVPLLAARLTALVGRSVSPFRRGSTGPAACIRAGRTLGCERGTPTRTSECP